MHAQAWLELAMSVVLVFKASRNVMVGKEAFAKAVQNAMLHMCCESAEMASPK